VLEIRDVPNGCTVEGLTFRSGFTEFDYGGGIFIEGSVVVVRDCVFEQCESEAGGGIAAYNASLTVHGCTFVENDSGWGGAIGAWQEAGPLGSLSISDTVFLRNSAGAWLCCTVGGGVAASLPELTITNSVFVGNKAGPLTDGAAVSASVQTGTISGCTMAYNEIFHQGNSIVFLASGGAFVLERNIIAFNTGLPFQCWSPNATLACSNVFGNSAGDAICLDDLGGNFSADPLFCDVDGGDFTLQADSPCLPGQHPDGADCDLIGALGEGCGGSTPVETTSWGRIKELYRP
jgi:hypothetical protein